ncbi:hypothetical protein [Amycolatopsis nigrescens]|uniref:hypothetical protein n=1 Tax=Amycolatopsis nigrescens TaxID=381445 RepID=UPI000380AEF5|nr:hypothetical protein [Amycolatopsis nigrescens]
MIAALFLLILIGLVVYGLQRNHVRQASPQVTGGDEGTDRDRVRIRTELIAMAGVTPPLSDR